MADDAFGQFIVGGGLAKSDSALVMPALEKPQLSAEGAQLLNARFDTVVVANDAVRTNEILRVFDGRVIIRAHGWRQPIGAELFHLGCYPIIQRRGNTHHVITDAQTVKDDIPIGAVSIAPAWFNERLNIFRDTWNGFRSTKRGRVAVSLPCCKKNNMDRRYSLFVEKHFPISFFDHVEHLGRRDIDSWKLQRHRIRALQTAAAYLYSSVDKNDLDMAPLEMMLIGGPVVFFDSGYLSALMPANSPGRVRTIDEAHHLCDRLSLGDRELTREILASQAALVDRYTVQVAGPKFDAAFTSVLNEPLVNRPGISRSGITYTPDLADRQMRRLMKAVTYEAGAEKSLEQWTPRDVITVFYTTVLAIVPEPEKLAAYAAALTAGTRPIDVLMWMIDDYRHLVSDHRNRLILSLFASEARQSLVSAAR
ncbi:hypothetical protein [Rhizobium sp. SL86]|uniref:hypothetical protein n=1 Tax=Rhizobium sp. SL86 TaxID=2995148 RepID=UPI00227239F9|nr:hypothetical protein [Rhizobium sp. SL86]MCY1669391.1 hypothetical protein [Rhizobium sp. SL86]